MDPLDHWSTEIRAPLAEQLDPNRHRLPLLVVETTPPQQELVGDLDLPHQPSMTNTS
jgi:hypothetical protein